MSEYPLIEKYGIKVRDDIDPQAPPGCFPGSLCATLYEHDLLEKWNHWAKGITSAGNGFYPCDVEKFLRGLPKDSTDTRR